MGLLLGVAVAACLLFLILASPARAIPVGVNWSGNLHESASAPEWDVIQRSGADVYRLGIFKDDWHTWGQSYYDTIFQRAAEKGVTILPYLVNSGYPQSGEPAYEQWYLWIKGLVKRYGHNGSFWVGKPYYKPVTAWELGNEPNLPQENVNYGGGEVVNPTRYGNFLVYMANAVRTASNEQAGIGTTVLMGGLYLGKVGGKGMGYAEFLNKAYNVAGFHSSFDGVSIHPYGFDEANPSGKTISEVTAEINGVRQLLNTKQWGPSRTLWVTEIGWPVAGTGQPTVTEPEQERLLNESFDWIESQAAAQKIELVAWYNLKDWDAFPSWAYRTGLRRGDGSYRLSWYAFQQQAAAPRWPVAAPPVKVAFPDASNAGSISAWEFSGSNGWQQAFLWGHKVAAGTKPVILKFGETTHILYVDASRENRITEWSWNSVTGWQQTFLETDPVAAGSSPSGVIVNGTPQVYFSDAATNRSIAVLVHNGSGWQQQRFYGDPVAVNSSPSAISVGGATHVYFADAAHGNTIAVWTWGATLQQHRFYGDPVAANSSPSAISVGGTAQVYFADAAQGNTIAVWAWGSTLQQHRFFGDSVAANSSPSAIANNGQAHVYFADGSKGNNIAVWTWGSTLQQSVFYGDPVAANTSPSAISVGGWPEIFFSSEATNRSIAVWQWGSTLQQTRLYGHPVVAGSSPGT